MEKKAIISDLHLPVNPNNSSIITLELIGLVDVDDVKIMLNSFTHKKYVTLTFEDLPQKEKILYSEKQIRDLLMNCVYEGGVDMDEVEKFFKQNK